jgi:diacylglycerol kinase family enzyme
MAGTLIVNPRSGDSRPSVEDLVVAAETRGLAGRVLGARDDAAELARQAPAEAIGIAGGDGSLATVAAVCAERDLPFVCVPRGTRNHFARDVGLDRVDPLAALAAFDEDAVERRIDLGRAGGRVFLNNVSLGLYAGLVHDREQRRRRQEAFARLKALRRLAAERDPVELTLDGAPLRAHLLLVANNSYTPMDVFAAGERERLDEGVLCLYVGRGVLPRHWEERRLERVVVDSPAGTVRAAVDGEPAELETPLELEVLPAALRVRVPRDRMPR